MKFILVSAALVLALNSCKKKDPPCTTEAGATVAPASEEQMITDYLTANNITFPPVPIRLTPNCKPGNNVPKRSV